MQSSNVKCFQVELDVELTPQGTLAEKCHVLHKPEFQHSLPQQVTEQK